MSYPDIQTVIKNYGIVHEWHETRGRKYSFSFTGSREHSCGAKITLLYPADRPYAQDNREVRQELYLQAESIVEVMKLAGFQFINPPRIILGGMEGQIEGTMEIEFMF